MGEQKRRDAVEVQMERNAVLGAVRALRQQDIDMRAQHPDAYVTQPPGWLQFQTELVDLIEKHVANLDMPLDCLGRSATAFMILAGHSFGSLLADQRSAVNFLNQNVNMAMHAFGAGMATGRDAVAKGQPVN